MAHDMTLGETVELYPKKANDWMARGWKEATRWGFCGEFTPVDEMDDKGQHAHVTGSHEVHESTGPGSKILSIVHLEHKEEGKKAELHSLPL
ncbi:hypothetical protein FVEG_17314 [Fusarium verticillioides 7600]|uniref:Uncharacterized protein n=1 Tax=Gibberella moniliformis (strain M3125 / FGSC 7600) TaxID=334819 RepID=W7N469_GIBM7|nr:hypothetical protein FVEG_17314 [Fusarium verticillioides 7600]EWG54419.1 hypothetical protein FVEG_17314 [Fusarium verticillioides 7600]